MLKRSILRKNDSSRLSTDRIAESSQKMPENDRGNLVTPPSSILRQDNYVDFSVSCRR